MAPLMWFERILVAFISALCAALDAHPEPTARPGDRQPFIRDFGQ